ncbi:uncharacterized protein LOC124165230 isoform X2 [Ischnura elegans]|uniref:uncharacterized protein LOC124165230 isoform X2 n=1 Tax=Ischnura elegans TaxID=197161 RepID=UPI001ED8BF93|nr:uncharacterized protein LOC124165230 isoform X2 [Ischnura elegans]
MQELRNAGSDAQKGDICLKRAALFHGGGEEKVVLYSGYKVNIGRNAKARIVHSAVGNPAKMQRQLLLELKGREHIMSHSAAGQRFGAEKGGLPATDKERHLQCRGTVCEVQMSGGAYSGGGFHVKQIGWKPENVCSAEGGKEVYSYPRKSTNSDAATIKVADIPVDVRRI